MPEQPKLCPFSFGFSLKQQIPSFIDPKKVDVKAQVGFPCIKERCVWYHADSEGCIAWDIFWAIHLLSHKKAEAP